MTAAHPTHPRFGRMVRLEQHGCEVHIILVANTVAQATSVCEHILAQLEAGEFQLAIHGKPSTINQEPTS